MEISLEKIDSLIASTGISFKQAKEALEKTGGNVSEAILLVESNGRKGQGKGQDFLEKICLLIKEGNTTKMTIRKDGRTILNLPVTLVAIGAFLAIKPVLLGLGLAFLSRCDIELVKKMDR